MPFQFVTVLNNFGPVIRSQVVSFFFSSLLGSADISRCTFCLGLLAMVLMVMGESDRLGCCCVFVLVNPKQDIDAGSRMEELSTAKMKMLVDVLDNMMMSV